MLNKFILLIPMCLMLAGCGHWSVIESKKQLSEPNSIKAEFLPIKAQGKATITKGTEKTVERDGFLVKKITINGMEGISISKADVKVTVAQASYEFMAKMYGLKGAVKHPLGGDDYKLMHVWGPWDAPAFQAHYKADNKEVYQVYESVPFYNCMFDVYRNESNQQLLKEFEEAFTDDKIRPFAFNDKRTSQEIKSQIEGIIGQPYCSSYYKSNIAFYVKIENLGNEKIRLWPVEESVVIDNNNSQYKALGAVKVEEILKQWNSHVSNLPKGKDNPVIGVHLSKKAIDAKSQNSYTLYEDGMVVLAVEKDLPADKAGILKGDILLEINDRSIDDQGDFHKALSNKMPGDTVTIKTKRDKDVKTLSLKLIGADDWPKPPKVKVLAGGNVYPNVVYDGYLVFDTSAMLNNYSKGSLIKLIIPLIGTSFDAGDRPIHSYDYEFDFELTNN